VTLETVVRCACSLTNVCRLDIVTSERCYKYSSIACMIVDVARTVASIVGSKVDYYILCLPVHQVECSEVEVSVTG